MHCEILTLCDAATTDGGKINILGSFDLMNIKDLKAQFPPFSVASRIRFNKSEAGKYKFRITISDEKKEKNLVDLKADLVVDDLEEGLDSGAINIVLNVSGFKPEMFGKHIAELFIDNNNIASVPLYLRKID